MFLLSLGHWDCKIQPNAKGHFALFNLNCLALGQTKYDGVPLAYCNPFLKKTFHGSHCLDIVMIRQQGINNGTIVVLPDTVWYALFLLLFSASAATDTGSRSLECTLVSMLETYNDPANGTYITYTTYICYVYYLYIPIKLFQVGWNLSRSILGSYTS